MKNTTKKNTTKKNTTKKCMETFAKKKIIYWTNDYTKEIKKLEKKKNLTKEEAKLLNKLKKQRKEQTNNLEKQYKLINCNVNCKNTLLEPGSPNEIPKSTRKEFHNSKKLIKIFTKRRKDIFKNKSNVLIDNFYENIPQQTKKNLIKEGAISECSLPLNLKGGSIIFENGIKNKTDETYNDKPFFRKVFYIDETTSNMEKRLRLEQSAKTEIYIVELLMKNQNPNIVTFYHINDKYVEMEELDITSKLDKMEVIKTMKKVKDFLQSIGIMYIDWKPDNIGISKDGKYKLYDFDASGVVDLTNPNVWIVKPLEYYSYNKAIENGITDPKEIDNYSFVKGMDIINNYRYL
jgi:serine/threonine protein kinase